MFFFFWAGDIYRRSQGSVFFLVLVVGIDDALLNSLLALAHSILGYSGYAIVQMADGVL